MLATLLVCITPLSSPATTASLGDSSADGPPRSVRHLVLNSRHRRVHDLKLGEVDFQMFTLRDDVPFLLWPAPGESVPFSKQRREVQSWLTANLPALGIEGFDPHFDEAWSWRHNQVWTYRLQRVGLELQDARIDFHWLDGDFQGLRVCVPRPFLTRSEDPSPESAGTSERTWFPDRRIDGELDGYDIVLAQVQNTTQERHVRTQYTSGGRVLSTVFSSLPVAPGTQAIAHAWTEYNVPSGFFPDQIETDSSGKIWFSQPNNNKITSFDPVTEAFSSPPTNIPSPDGLIVDSQDRVWTGLYSSNAGLGMVDLLTGTYTSYPAPYPGAYMAIPYEDITGNIWITDHQRNRVSVFDPQTSTFRDSMVMPTAGAWVVDGAQDPATQTMYFQEFNANKLAVKPLGQPMYDFPATNGGPAFVVYSQGKVYMGLWNVGRLGVYDIASGQVSTYAYPDTNNVGGPVDVLSNGDVVATGRNFGAIYIFRLATQTFDRFLIPTASAGIKDGVHVDANDVIWITETGANKIAKLELL